MLHLPYLLPRYESQITRGARLQHCTEPDPAMPPCKETQAKQRALEMPGCWLAVLARNRSRAKCALCRLLSGHDCEMLMVGGICLSGGRCAAAAAAAADPASMPVDNALSRIRPRRGAVPV